MLSSSSEFDIITIEEWMVTAAILHSFVYHFLIMFVRHKYRRTLLSNI